MPLRLSPLRQGGLITGVDLTLDEAALFQGRGHCQQLRGQCLCPEGLWVAQPSTPRSQQTWGLKNDSCPETFVFDARLLDNRYPGRVLSTQSLLACLAEWLRRGPRGQLHYPIR